ncbi:hypothetical protein [Ruminococcus sp. Marseille-P6503]|uniref:hypothetical protein n=1 Tax=Ruminococcus sp. Marseille-P6503 TaxID=2364796 RepID=UPI000F525A06|nr:hypothetical protein [Ruminococcus sp. Marseille-P6503]
MTFLRRNIKITKYDKLKDQFDLLLNKSNDIYRKYKDISQFVNLVNEKGYSLVQTYDVDGELYGIFLKWDHSHSHDTIYLKTYATHSRCPICKSDSDISDERLEIVNLNTDESYQKEGHASRHINIYISIAKKLRKDKIYGMLYFATPIGIDNLKKFYVNNGFEINGHYFRMILKNAHTDI